jgi:hypothetical protein
LSDEAEKKIGKMIAINRLEGLEKSILDKEHPVYSIEGIELNDTKYTVNHFITTYI